MANAVAINVRGGKRIAFGLRKAASEITDLRPERAAQIMLTAARLRAPVKSGTLRMSGETVNGGIAFFAPYAGPIHWGWPRRNITANQFALRGVEESRAQWEAVYRETVQDSLDEIEGE